MMDPVGQRTTGSFATYTFKQAQSYFAANLSALIGPQLFTAITSSPVLQRTMKYIAGTGVHGYRTAEEVGRTANSMNAAGCLINTKLVTIEAMVHDVGKNPFYIGEQDTDFIPRAVFDKDKIDPKDLLNLNTVDHPYFSGSSFSEEDRYHPNRPTTVFHVALITLHASLGAAYLSMPWNRLKGLSDEEIKEVVLCTQSHHGTMATQARIDDVLRDQIKRSVYAGVLNYPGPLPSSKEAALVMIGDECDARLARLHHKALVEAKKAFLTGASDSVIFGILEKDPIKSKYVIREAVVRRVLDELEAEGQLAKSGLTARDKELILEHLSHWSFEVWNKLESDDQVFREWLATPVRSV